MAVPALRLLSSQRFRYRHFSGTHQETIDRGWADWFGRCRGVGHDGTIAWHIGRLQSISRDETHNAVVTTRRRKVASKMNGIGRQGEVLYWPRAPSRFPKRAGGLNR